MLRDVKSRVAKRLVPAVFVWVGAFAGSARADAPPFRASMACHHEAGSGRLLCTVALAPGAGLALSWSDALVVAAPPGVQPLRARVTSSSREPERIVIGFVLGSGAGGPIEVLARAVTCPAAGRSGACRAVSTQVRFSWETASG
jgi:hypothetical protein